MNMRDRPLDALGFGSLKEEPTALFAEFWRGVHGLHVGEIIGPPVVLTCPSGHQSQLLLLLGRGKLHQNQSSRNSN